MSTALASLDALAAEANENHKLAESTAGRAIEYARKAGAALIEAKSQVGHGKWMVWLADNFDGHVATAWRYMKVSANFASVQNLEPKSYTEALRMIAGDGEEESEPEEPEEDEAPPVVVTPAPTKERPTARSVPVEVVEDEEEEGEPVVVTPETTPERGVAIVYARTALDALNKIPKRDPSRKEAITMIANWLESNR